MIQVVIQTIRNKDCNTKTAILKAVTPHARIINLLYLTVVQCSPEKEHHVLVLISVHIPQVVHLAALTREQYDK